MKRNGAQMFGATWAARVANNQKIASWRTRGRRRIGNPWGLLFILPVVLDFVVFSGAMIVRAVVMSFHELRFGGWQWVGLENFAFSIADDRFWNAVRNTSIYTIGVVIGGLAIALPISAHTVRRRAVTQAMVKGSLYLPGVVSTVALSMVWLYIYQPIFGLMNYMLGLVGLPPVDWLANPVAALPAIILMSLISTLGIAVVLLTASMGSIPSTYYEAAAIDGAGAVQQFLHVTVPFVKPVIFYLLVVGFVTHFQVFEQIFIMTNGGPGFPPATETVALRIYNAISGLRLGAAAADSVLLFLLIGGFALIQYRLLGDDAD